MPKTTETQEAVSAPAPTPAPAVPSQKERLVAAERIVKNNMYWSMGCGAVPVPLVDLVGVGGFQIRMLKEISDLYGVKFSEHFVRNILASLVGTIGARVLTVATVSSAIKTLPFAGALIGGVVAMPVIAGASTYAVGRVFVRHFEMGGTFADFSVERAKGFFGAQFKEGHKVAGEAATAPA